MTSDIKAMQEGVARIDSRGGTAMRDAINGGIDYLKKEGKRQKKVLLVITDGNDNASTMNLEKLVTRAQQNEVLIFAIGLLNEEERHEAKIAKRALDTLARESGGLSFYPKGVCRRRSDRFAGGARNSQSIYPGVFAYRSANGWQLPPD